MGKPTLPMKMVPKRPLKQDVTLKTLEDMTKKVKNWGRWGADDQLGTLNFVSPEDIKKAASLVKKGRTFALGLDFNSDGDTDLLWYNPVSGKIVFWFMNYNASRIAGQFANPSNAGANNWKVLAAGDYGAGGGDSTSMVVSGELATSTGEATIGTGGGADATADGDVAGALAARSLVAARARSTAASS